MAALLFASVLAADNLITNPSLDSDLTGWTHGGCTIESKCGDQMAYCEAGESIYQDITPDADGVYRVQWRGEGSAISWHYGYFQTGAGGNLDATWNDGVLNCTNSDNHYVGLQSGTEYRLKFLHNAYNYYVDNAVVIKYRDYVTHTYDAYNLLDNAGFYGSLDDWTTVTGTPLYDVDEGDDDPGRLNLGDNEAVSQSVTLDSSGVYTYGFSLYAGGTGWAIMGIYTDGTNLVAQITDGPCGAYCSEQGTVELDAGTYQVRLTGKSSGANFDDIYFLGGSPVYDPGDDDAISWTGVTLYYPYEQSYLISHYQTYSDTTWYGSGYANWNIYQLTPGAPVYPVAALDIMDVGVGTFGYYVDARINAYQDIPSTTIRYEGLATVNVAAGQRILENCELGTVGANRHLHDYHLLLYGEFDGSPINLHPYMSHWPDPAMCMVFDPAADTPGPAAGEIPVMLQEYCQSCNVPQSWTNFGRWVAWLECMIANMFSRWLVEWINGVIYAVNMVNNAVILSYNGTLAQLRDIGNWMGATVGGGVDYVQARTAALGARLDNLGYIVMSFGGGVTYITEESGTNYWDVLVSIFSFMSNVVDLFSGLITGAFDLLITMLDLVTDMLNLVVMLVSGLLSGLFGGGGGADTDLIAQTLDMDSLNCSAGGVWAGDGDSKGKFACILMLMINLVNDTIATTTLRYIVPVGVGIIALLVGVFVLQMSDRMVPT